MENDRLFAHLREAVELKAGRKVRTPKDFDYLHDRIFDECHDMVSTSTLKRIWGYVTTEGQPRTTSLDLLARYVGYDDWEQFAVRQTSDGQEPQQSAATQPVTARRRKYWLMALGAAVIAVIAIYVLTIGQASTGIAGQHSGQRILRKGQDSFRNIDQYLVLFGIEGGDTAYFRPVPGLEYVYVWGPEYGHPVWHNEGDSLQLMPTITEYWQPLPGIASYQSEEYIKEVNAKLYYERLTKDELRITFMRDLVDGFYVFLGVYRLDRELSNIRYCVWRRVADELDLGRLSNLEQLRENSR